jgi:hypothetical protein
VLGDDPAVDVAEVGHGEPSIRRVAAGATPQPCAVAFGRRAASRRVA